MSVPFRVGRYIAPSGFALAVVDIPQLDAEKNISLIDYSHRWEENIASAETSLVKSYVDYGGHMPKMTVTEFMVTNAVTRGSNDTVESPLWYRHRCRFHHYTYGENPSRQISITDGSGNILKDLNFSVKSTRVMKNVYRIDVLTDFENNESSQYKVKYNRCYSDGTNVYTGWVETLNTTPYFTLGSPFSLTDQYSLDGPDNVGLYEAIVPPVPTITPLVNSIGISFENAPTIIDTSSSAYVTEYDPGVVVTYTLKATSPTTFTVKRDKNLSGTVLTEYLIATTTWGAGAVSWPTGTDITGIPGTIVHVHDDNPLRTNDEATFTESRSYYYLMPTAYSAIYLKKPTHVTPDDDWYIKVKNGGFRRWVDASGNVVPSGNGTLYEYGLPEYDAQMWDLTYGPPYKRSLNERVELLDQRTLQLQQTPIYIDPSSVLYNPDYPGFAPTGYILVYVNDALLPSTGVIDWDLNNGTVTLDRYVTHRDDITVTYRYKQEYYDYDGFVGSGAPYPTVPPFPYYNLDLNPTPEHNYGMYASGSIAHLFLHPYIDVSNLIQIRNEALYHNFTGTPEGVFDFHIGSISLSPHCSIDDLQITDVRNRGGGLSKLGVEKIDLVEEIQPEAEFFWDVGYFDGQAVPANGALLIKIPKTVLEQNGGAFTEDDVRQRVQKHMALGIFPIIEYI